MTIAIENVADIGVQGGMQGELTPPKSAEFGDFSGKLFITCGRPILIVTKTSGEC